MRFFLTFLLVAALPSAAQSLSGRRAPSFSLPDASTAQHDILDYRGNWLLLDFMQTGNNACKSCKDLTRKLEGMKTKYGSKLAVVSVVLSPPENGQTVGKYVSDTKSTTVYLFDQGQVTITYYKATPQNPNFDVPHLFLVSPAGIIVKDWNESAILGPGFLASISTFLDAAPTKGK